MFKAIFRDMDLYKGIILASVALLPAVGWWAWSLQERISAGNIAVRKAQGRGGLLQQIGLLQRDMEEVHANKVGGITSDFRTFFQSQIFASSKNPLGSTDFTISTEQNRKVSSLRAIDSEVTIEFKKNGKDPYALPRDYINALLYNFENASKVWRLRHVRIRNESTERLVSQRRPPPPEFGDQWLLEKLVFARRSPDPTAVGSRRGR